VKKAKHSIKNGQKRAKPSPVKAKFIKHFTSSQLKFTIDLAYLQCLHKK